MTTPLPTVLKRGIGAAETYPEESRPGVFMHKRLIAITMLTTALAAMLFAAPTVACAANAYGQVFAGQAKCLSCHGDVGGSWQVATYPDTAHGRFITDVQVATASLVPTPTSTWWPSPAFGGGLAFKPRDVWLMAGAPGITKEYVSVYRNDGPHTLLTSVTVSPIAGPSDDYWLFDPIGWLPSENTWELAGPVGVRLYFQGCGGCHNLGVTRATDTTYTLSNGGTVGHSTETSYAGLGIQCENCHGTGSTRYSHHQTGVDVVRTKQVLKSQTCGQCHVSGTAKEKNYLGKTFSSPNGFTPDKNLEDFYSITGIQYIRASAAASEPVIPSSETKFYPDGHNRSMNHVYYNEWMLSAHARSLKWRDGSLWSSNAKSTCLRCHSGEGFLKSIGYGATEPNDVSIFGSSVASDTLNIECSVCHTVHATAGDALGLRLPKGRLCQACHTGRIPEGAEATPGVTARYTQAEMLAGYGLIGVPRAEAFMTNTDCVDCHMPVTRDPRVSHRFTPMLPGNAAAWGVRAEGDSCTPCHKTRTRAELQASLDAWRTEIDAATADASAAIAAAAVRPSAAGTAGARLLAAARTNLSFVMNDKSGGAHNEPYAKAGLVKTAYFGDAVGASFTSFASTAFDERAGLAMVYGRFVMGDGSVRQGERISIEAASATGTWTPVATVTTLASGDFVCAAGPTGTTSYRARWVPMDDAASIVSATTTVVVAPRVMPSATTLAVSASAVKLGGTVMIRGLATPAGPYDKVAVMYRWGSDEWRTLCVRSLDARGTYAYAFKPGRRGTWSIQTVFPKGADHAGSVSRAVTVRVY